MIIRITFLAALLSISIQGAGMGKPGSPAATGPKNGNSVAAFLRNAERQTETDEQRKEVQRALRDMLEKPPAELRQIRYSDYAGKKNEWSVTQLLQHYFVPSRPAALDETHFYEDLKAPAARAAVQRQLNKVTRALQ